nr:PD-(D/E)XK nuclease family protein [Pseudomonas sp.]
AEDDIARAPACRFAADDQLGEWRAAAAWAARQLETTTGRFAIVAADLQDNAPFARRVLHAALGEQPFNLSVGRPLDEWPLVRAALAWLSLLAQPAPYAPADLSRALLSGHCVGHESEAAARAQLDAQWRFQQTLTLSNSEWQRALHACPVLGQAWEVAQAAFRHDACGHRAGTSADWTPRIRAGLAALGFPGDVPLDSTGYQVFEAFQELLQHFAALAPATGELSATEAVALLTRLARETPFQPERAANARLDVLGLLEAEGERWDGVWILGMTDDVLPAPPSPNPLLPASALAQANAPRATAARELAYAHDLFDALLHCAPNVIVSHALLEGERELRPSPLIAQLPAITSPNLQTDLASVGSLARTDVLVVESGPSEDSATDTPGAADDSDTDCLASPGRVALEPLVHDPGPPLSPELSLSGGTAILDTQARNPLWAFARYRLGARALPAHAQQLALSSLRGNFLHLAMQTLWESLRSSRALAQALANDTLPSLLDHAVETAARRELRTFSPALRELECMRARSVLAQWLELESQREPFEIASIEGKQQWTRGPLRLTLRLDRVDRLLGTGSLAILDYKSGTQLDINGWARERPVSLQLPFYAAVLGTHRGQGGYGLPAEQERAMSSLQGYAPRVSALALARLNARHVTTLGVAGEPVGLPGVLDLSAGAPDDRRRRPSPFEQAGWAAWLSHWQQSIEALADEFIAGRADNVTIRPTDLQYCDVLPFLRNELEIDIDEVTP